MSSKPVLRLENACIGYKNALVENINACLQTGEITLLIGNNGEGKTTLIKSILGQIKLLHGKIFIENTDISNLLPKELSLKIAIVFSKSNIPSSYTVKDLISLGKYVHYPYYISLSKKDIIDIELIIEKLGLQSLADYPLTELSDGNLQKAFIGRAIAQDTPLLILDEPITHLDKTNRNNILSILKEIAKDNHKSILFSSHDIDTSSSIADNIWQIENKQMISGFAEDILLKNHLSNIITTKQKDSSPKILAPSFETLLLKKAIKKHVQKDCSHLTISYKDYSWLINNDKNNESKKCNTIAELVSFLNI